MGIKDKLDIIAVENNIDGSTELWITIKDASDLLGCSERHTWNYVDRYRWETQKKLNHQRLKTFVKRSSVEAFINEEKIRQELESERTAKQDFSTETTKIGIKKLFDPSVSSEEAATFQKSKVTAELVAKFPILVSEFNSHLEGIEGEIKSLVNIIQTKETLVKKVAKWKVAALFSLVLVIIISGVTGFWLWDTKQTLSTKEDLLSIKEEKVSFLNREVGIVTERLTRQGEDLEKAEKEISEKDSWIQKLEKIIAGHKLQSLKQEETNVAE